MTQTQTIICINSGSSSLKFHVYEMGWQQDYLRVETVIARGAVEGLGQPRGRLWFVDGEGHPFAGRDLDEIGHTDAIEQVLGVLASEGLPSVEAVGHRVVHGGPDHRSPVLITSAVLKDLRRHVAWASLHMPASLQAIEALDRLLPDMPQVACFDTAFHAGMPEVARRLPLPRPFFDEGIHRYGFHGLSYEYVLSCMGGQAEGRLVIAHLGNGGSMAACRDGRPIDTTMGMTPLGGFMMGTRTGDLDPGVLLYLLRERGYSSVSLERLVDQESGLKGVSGETGDMERLLELRAAGHTAAAQAIEMYAYQARKTVGALAAALGGLDQLVFTGGIGENAAEVRELICEGLQHLGIELDQSQTGKASGGCGRVISRPGGQCLVRVIHTNEDLMIARHTYDVVFAREQDKASGVVEGGPQ